MTLQRSVGGRAMLAAVGAVALLAALLVMPAEAPADPAGPSLGWAVRMGGPGEERGEGVAVDGAAMVPGAALLSPPD